MPILCIFHDDGDMIDEDCADEVQRLLTERGPFASLTVVIDSPGGDVDCAYRIIRAIRESAREVEVLVPAWAKSAATLICIGADRILLGSAGEMGPLDMQVADPTGKQEFRSVLETFQRLTQIRQHALETLGEFTEYFRNEEGLDAPHCYERAEVPFAAFVMALYQHADTSELGELGRYQASVEEYAARIMGRWGYPDYEEEDIDDIVKQLIWDYPTHGFVVDLHEAKNLELRADRLDPGIERLCKELLDVAPALIDLCLPTTQAATRPMRVGDGEE